MNTELKWARWLTVGALVIAWAAAAAKPNGPPAYPIDNGGIAVVARNVAVLVPPGTVIRMAPAVNQQQLRLVQIAQFANSSQLQTQRLLPTDYLPTFDYVVPDETPATKIRLSLMGLDESNQQVEIQVVTVIVDPKAVCSARASVVSPFQAELTMLGENITAAYVFADNNYVGKAEGTGDPLKLSLSRLTPGHFELSIIAEDQYKLLYHPCPAFVDIPPRFDLSLSASSVAVRDAHQVVNLAIKSLQAPAADEVASLRFMVGGNAVGGLTGSSGQMAIPVGTLASGKYDVGVQGITKDGEIMGLETVPLVVSNPVQDKLNGTKTAEETISDGYSQLRLIDMQLDDILRRLVLSAYNVSWYYAWDNGGYYGNTNLNLGWGWNAPTLNSLRNYRGLFTIPILDNYVGLGIQGTYLYDARQLILQRAQVQLQMAQVFAKTNRKDRAKAFRQDIDEEAFGTWVQREADSVLGDLQ